MGKAIVKSSREIAILCARIAEEKKAEDVIVLDLRKFLFITDFFVICTSKSPRQSRAIASELEIKLKSIGVRKIGEEEDRRSLWILIDFGDVIVHIIDHDRRRFYDLESLWADAPRIRWRKKVL